VYLITIIGGDNVSSFSRAPYVLSLREVFLHHVCKLVSSVISSSDIFRGLNCQDTVPRSVRTQCRGVSGHSAAECQDTVPRSVRTQCRGVSGHSAAECPRLLRRFRTGTYNNVFLCAARGRGVQFVTWGHTCGAVHWRCHCTVFCSYMDIVKFFEFGFGIWRHADTV